MTPEQKTRMQYAGAIALLCECHLQLPNEGLEVEDLRDGIQRAVADFCAVTGWTHQIILDRIELEPPEIGYESPAPTGA